MTEKILDSLTEQIIQTLADAAVRRGWLAMQRSHKVLDILKKLKLVQLDKDFGAVYIHALAEYGVDKTPAGLLRLFALREVRDALENDYRNNTDTFLREVEAQLHTHPSLTDLKPITPT